MSAKYRKREQMNLKEYMFYAYAKTKLNENEYKEVQKILVQK